MTLSDVKLINFDLDYLRVTFPAENYPDLEFFNSLFNGLSLNSDIGEVYFFGRKFVVEYRSIANMVILDFRDGLIRVFTLEKPLEAGLGRFASFRIQFYGAFFQKNYSKDLLKEFFNQYKKIAKITRADLALDIDKSVYKVFKTGYKTRYKNFDFKHFNPENHDFQTWYIGDRRSSRNKKHFIRVYDKRLELSTKSQLKLAEFQHYRDYIQNYDEVARIEIQLNSMSCNNYNLNPSNILDMDHLKRVFRSIAMNSNGTYLKILKGIFKQTPDILVVRRSIPSEVIDKLSYARTMRGYVSKLEQVGFDTLEYLTEQVYSQT